MGDNSQAFHLVEVFLDLQAWGDGAFPGACIMGWMLWGSQILYSPGYLPMPMNQSGNSFIKSSVDLMDLAAVGAVAGLVEAAAVETGAGCGGFMPGHMTVMAQFILMTASFFTWGKAQDGRTRGVCVVPIWIYPVGSSTRAVWPPSDGAIECTI